jgi:hypothetical protein
MRRQCAQGGGRRFRMAVLPQASRLARPHPAGTVRRGDGRQLYPAMRNFGGSGVSIVDVPPQGDPLWPPGHGTSIPCSCRPNKSLRNVELPQHRRNPHRPARSNLATLLCIRHPLTVLVFAFFLFGFCRYRRSVRRFRHRQGRTSITRMVARRRRCRRFFPPSSSSQRTRWIQLTVTTTGLGVEFKELPHRPLISRSTAACLIGASSQQRRIWRCVAHTRPYEHKDSTHVTIS